MKISHYSGIYKVRREKHTMLGTSKVYSDSVTYSTYTVNIETGNPHTLTSKLQETPILYLAKWLNSVHQN